MKEQKRDIVSTVATYGAPALCVVLFLLRIAGGHWGSLAFMAGIFGIVFIALLFLGADDSDYTPDEIDAAGGDGRDDQEPLRRSNYDEFR